MANRDPWPGASDIDIEKFDPDYYSTRDSEWQWSTAWDNKFQKFVIVTHPVWGGFTIHGSENEINAALQFFKEQQNDSL